MNVTADEAALMSAEGDIKRFLESLPETGAGEADWTQRLPLVNEAITVPTQVGPLQDRVQAIRCATVSSKHKLHATSLTSLHDALVCSSAYALLSRFWRSRIPASRCKHVSELYQQATASMIACPIA